MPQAVFQRVAGATEDEDQMRIRCGSDEQILKGSGKASSRKSP